MNSIVVFEHEFKQNRITIADAHRLSHLQQVIKAKLGQELKVTVLGHGLSVAQISKIDSREMIMEVIKDFQQPQYPHIHLVVGLSRPPTMKKILEHASSMGVRYFHFFPAKLSEKSYGDSKIWSDGKAEQAMIDGLSQSAHYWHCPEIHLYKSMNQLPSFDSADRRILSLADGQKKSMKPIDKEKDLVLAFGPERGFTSEEDQILQERGFQAVSLGPSVLRVEIAVFASLAQAQFLL